MENGYWTSQVLRALEEERPLPDLAALPQALLRLCCSLCVEGLLASVAHTASCFCLGLRLSGFRYTPTLQGDTSSLWNTQPNWPRDCGSKHRGAYVATQQLDGVSGQTPVAGPPLPVPGPP